MKAHPHDIRGQAQSLAQAEDRRKARLAQELADVGNLMAEPWGRRIAWGLFNRAGLIYGDAMQEEGVFNPNSMTMAHTTGRREVMWRIDHVVRRHYPGEWNLMLQENANQ